MLLRLAALVLVAGLLLPAARLGAAAGVGPDGVPLESVIRDFEKSLADAQAQIMKRGLPRIRSVEVSLQTVLRRASVGGARVGVYTLDMPWNEDHAQEVTLTLVRAPDDTRYETSSAAATSPRLVENLIALSEASQAGQERNIGMRLTELSSSLRFVMTRSGARSSFEAVPVSPSLGAALEGRAVHGLSVVFSATSR